MPQHEISYDLHERSLLPEGGDSFVSIAKFAERVPFSEHEKIISNLAAAGAEADADDDRHRFAWSYMPLVVYRACLFRNRTKSRSTHLDDYMQSGIVGLYTAIDTYVRAPEHKAFAPYAAPVIDRAIREQHYQDFFHTVIDNTLKKVVEYCSYTNILENGTVSLRKACKALQVSRGTFLTGLSLFTSSSEIVLVDNQRPEVSPLPEVPCPKPGLDALSPTLEKALLLLAPKRRRYIEQYYGLLPDEPTLSLEEICHAEGLANEAAARSLRNAGIKDLRLVLQYLTDYGTDFSKWPEKRFGKHLNVVTYLYRAGIAIPAEMSVEDLRVIAMQDLQKRNATAEEKRLIAEMFGLHATSKSSLAQLAKAHNTTDTRLVNLAKRLFAQDCL